MTFQKRKLWSACLNIIYETSRKLCVPSWQHTLLHMSQRWKESLLDVFNESLSSFSSFHFITNSSRFARERVCMSSIIGLIIINLLHRAERMLSILETHTQTHTNTHKHGGRETHTPQPCWETHLEWRWSGWIDGSPEREQKDDMLSKPSVCTAGTAV